MQATAHLREVGEGTVLGNNGLQKRRDLGLALENVIANWRALCMQLMRTTVVGHVNFLFAPVLAWILCAPKYLNGTMALGEVVQVAAAFVMVQGALNWFVDNYQRLADWVSSVNRVSSLLLALDRIDLCETIGTSAIIMRVEQRQPLQQRGVAQHHVLLHDRDELSAGRTPVHGLRVGDHPQQFDVRESVCARDCSPDHRRDVICFAGEAS